MVLCTDEWGKNVSQHISGLKAVSGFAAQLYWDKIWPRAETPVTLLFKCWHLSPWRTGVRPLACGPFAPPHTFPIHLVNKPTESVRENAPFDTSGDTDVPLWVCVTDLKSAAQWRDRSGHKKKPQSLWLPADGTWMWWKHHVFMQENVHHLEAKNEKSASPDLGVAQQVRRPSSDRLPAQCPVSRVSVGLCGRHAWRTWQKQEIAPRG